MPGPLDGRVVLVTGANAGIGKETTRGLARLGARVIMAVRDVERGEEALAEIARGTGNEKLEVRKLDLARLAEVREFARDLRASTDRLDVLVNNAGFHTSQRTVTPDGHESTFAVNHLAHFLLTQELLPLLEASAPSRVVNVASEAHRNGSLRFLDDPGSERSWSGLRAYCNSKLANILFTYELARRLDGTGVSVFAVHPGSVRTGWARGKDSGFFRFIAALYSPLMISPEKGARTSIYAASSHELDGTTGLYLKNGRVARSSADSRDVAAQKRLWELSESMTSRIR